MSIVPLHLRRSQPGWSHSSESCSSVSWGSCLIWGRYYRRHHRRFCRGFFWLMRQSSAYWTSDSLVWSHEVVSGSMLASSQTLCYPFAVALLSRISLITLVSAWRYRTPFGLLACASVHPFTDSERTFVFQSDPTLIRPGSFRGFYRRSIACWFDFGVVGDWRVYC